MKKLAAVLIGLIAIGALTGIWLYANRDEAAAPQPTSTSVDESETAEDLPPISSDEVALRNTADECWTIINDVVYDITSYVPRHPGGAEILQACGTDGTSLFAQRQTEDGEAVGSGTPHSAAAESRLQEYQIGTLAE